MTISMLVLFDIDGTLLRTAGAGMDAMLACAHELFPAHTFSFENVSISGRLDRLIWRDLMANAQVEVESDHHERFRARYGHHLEQAFLSGAQSMPLRGARALVDALHACTEPGASHPLGGVGLLTGNYEHTGRLKVQRAGFSLEPFQFNAWADDGWHRRDLPPVAIARFCEQTQRPMRAEQTVIIGDTPLDIDCAHFNGCLAIAVATGAHTMDELQSHSPDLLVQDLDDWRSVAQWITSQTQA